MNPDSTLLDYTHIMFDIETMGTHPAAPILSIGAVPFNPDSGVMLSQDKCFHMHINLAETLEHADVRASGSTITWWLGQDDDARSKILAGQEHAKSEAVVLHELYGFLRQHTNLDTVRVWGNGASFDPVLLETAYKRCGYAKAPWQFYNVRCFRTLKNLMPALLSKDALAQPRVKHDALEDAWAQAINAVRIIQHLPVVAANV